MSVHCRIVIGPTVEIQRNLKSADFRKYHDYIDNHPDMEDNYSRLHQPGDKMILFADGMNGHYLRLTYVKKVNEDSRIDNGDNMVELNTPIDAHVVIKMKEIYQEYTGEMLDEKLIKYVMWTQWT